MPGGPTFSQANNKYDLASYKRICNEFGIDSSSDFRLTSGKNNGLGSVYIYVSHSGPEKTEYDYPGSNKFSDEGGSASKGNLIYYIYQDSEAEAQADWFCKNTAEGLTQAGLSRINQSIEAFVYCFGFTGQCSKQHSGLRRARKGGANRVSCLGGRRDKATGPGGVCSKIPACR